MSENKKRKNPFEGIVHYFKDVRGEMKKVVWPTYKQIQNNTIIVLVSILVVGIFIWVLDIGFGGTLGTVVDKYGIEQNQSSQSPNVELPEGIQVPDAGQAEGGQDQPIAVPQKDGE